MCFKFKFNGCTARILIKTSKKHIKTEACFDISARADQTNKKYDVFHITRNPASECVDRTTR